MKLMSRDFRGISSQAAPPVPGSWLADGRRRLRRLFRYSTVPLTTLPLPDRGAVMQELCSVMQREGIFGRIFE